MQEYGLLQDLGYRTTNEFCNFWQKRIELSRVTGADPIHAYMYLICREAKAKGITIDNDSLKAYGKHIKLFKGAEDFIPQIKKYALTHNIDVDAFVISSGIRDIIAGSSIAKHLKEIYACEYIYGDLPWPSKVVDGDTKKKIIKNLYKGISNNVDPWLRPSNKVRAYNHIIYFGDSLADTDCMSFIRDIGGLSVAVFDYDDRIAQTLRDLKAANCIVKADYQENSTLIDVVKKHIDNIKTNTYVTKDNTLKQERRSYVQI